MGIFERIKRIISSNMNDDARSFDQILHESDEELRKLIAELNAPRPQTSDQSQRQQNASPRRHTEQVNAVYKAYQVLGLKPNATVEQIKASYRKMMREYHPDMVTNASKQKQEEAKRRAQDINLAYEVLAKVRGF